MDNEIPSLIIQLDRNPNHKYRFYVMGKDFIPRWLFTMRFSNKDQSVYVMPLFDRGYLVKLDGPEISRQYFCSPGTDFHWSFHESGVVNLTAGGITTRLRDHLDKIEDVRHVASFKINHIASLPKTTLEETNKPRGGHLYLPVMGLPLAPILLTVVCVRAGTDWSPPAMGNTMMLNYRTSLKGKNFEFHFIQWQHLRMEADEGDISIKLGGGDSDFFEI